MNVPVSLLRSEWPPNDGIMPGNARFDTMLSSIEKFGILKPITINLAWYVLDGHHRVAAARRLGIGRVEARIWTGVEFIE